MAEKGAHLATVFVKKPSIFELLAQEALSNTFYPAFRHLANFLINYNPVRYGFITEWFEELYLVFNTFIQYHYLVKYNATFSERFYNLKRVPLRNITQTGSLSRNQKMLSIFFVTLFPYVRNKMKILFEENENVTNENITAINKTRMMTFYKAFHLIIESLSMLHHLQYMTGRSDVHSVFLKMAGLTLIYSHEKEPERICFKDALKNVFSGNWRSSLDLIKLMKHFFGRSLELSAFFIQFLSWWHTEQINLKHFAYPIPPAPQQDENSAAKSNGICPVCKNIIKTPTALSTTGFVYCYKCIQQKIAEEGRCPVTGLPSTKEDLIRIYTEQQ